MKVVKHVVKGVQEGEKVREKDEEEPQTDPLGGVRSLARSQSDPQARTECTQKQFAPSELVMTWLAAHPHTCNYVGIAFNPPLFILHPLLSAGHFGERGS